MGHENIDGQLSMKKENGNLKEVSDSSDENDEILDNKPNDFVTKQISRVQSKSILEFLKADKELNDMKDDDNKNEDSFEEKSKRKTNGNGNLMFSLSDDENDNLR